jgi:squalene synthase HpnC
VWPDGVADLAPGEGARVNQDKGLRRAGVSAKGVAGRGGLADSPSRPRSPRAGIPSRIVGMDAFRRDLVRFGPDAAAPPALAEARSYCARLARRHYENFTVASLLLPRRLLPHFHAVYAWCRWADDLGDETGGGPDTLALLRWWGDELRRCYDGTPRHPVTVALAPTVRRFGIPMRPFLDLLSAFEQDQTVKEYDSFDQLLDYCRRSADPVGRLVLYLCEAFDDKRADLADRICTGLQLANFWQDVGRDLDIGRVYLPREDRDRFGYAAADLRARRFNPAFAELMRFQVERTRCFFERGRPLVGLMPNELRGDIELFLRGGLATLEGIEAVGYDVWSQRPTVSKWRKGALLLGAVWRRLLTAVGV